MALDNAMFISNKINTKYPTEIKHGNGKSPIFRSMISQQSSSLGISQPACRSGKDPGAYCGNPFSSRRKVPPIDNFITQYEIFINKNGDLSQIYDR